MAENLDFAVTEYKSALSLTSSSAIRGNVTSRVPTIMGVPLIFAGRVRHFFFGSHSSMRLPSGSMIQAQRP